MGKETKMDIVSTGQLKAQSISLQVSDRTRCNGSCKCCISRTTPNTAGLDEGGIKICDVADVEKGLDFAKRIGATHAILTGKAEPTQENPGYIYNLIKTCRDRGFLVDMHTNGFLLQDHIKSRHTLHALKQAGLTMVTFSIFHHLPNRHEELTGLKVDFPTLIKEANCLGLLVRCSLVLAKSSIGTTDDVLEFIRTMGDYGVHMVVVRELWLPTIRGNINKEVYEWNYANLVKLYEVSNQFSDMAKLKHKSIVWYQTPILELAPLPWGAKVFAMEGEGCFKDEEHGVNITFALCEENDKGPVMKSIVHKPNGHGYRNWDFNANILY